MQVETRRVFLDVISFQYIFGERLTVWPGTVYKEQGFYFLNDVGRTYGENVGQIYEENVGRIDDVNVNFFLAFLLYYI